MHSFAKILKEISSWGDFFTFTNSLLEKEKGDLFESLTKLILTTKPEYSSILKNVWIQREGIPTDIKEKLNLPSTDEGIDLVAETFTGEYWAIQCKFKGQNQAPTYRELATFGNLANNYCTNISLALLVHTGEKGVRKRKLLGENYTEIGLEFWLGLTSEDWDRIHKSLKGQSIRPKPKVPRSHQQKAISSSINHFIRDKASRGRLIMPCGTGKSLTALWIANAMQARSIIVSVPSLALIKQSLEDWTREFLAHNETPLPEWLVICSDESTANLDKDEFVSEAYSLGIPTTTDVEEISSFLSRSYGGRKILFTTYQSSDRLAQAARRCNSSFDLAILDEAHKTVGVKSKTFATLLSDENIQILKRMFMTATERVIRGNDDDIYSMDDKDTYGSLFYQLSFKDAIHSEPPIICDYKVLTITVTSEEIKQLIDKNKLITDKEKKLEEQESQSFASAIALRKATQKYGIKHAISFHRSIKSADDFAKLNRHLNEGGLDNITLNSSHISSKISAGARARLLNDFSLEQLALMTNARCLSEGVDVPAIDCVLFADPKQSTIDIVQAAGRALRPFAGKEFGYIMLPLIVPDYMSLEEFTETTSFKTVAKIISALSTQDERIAEEFRLINNGKQSSEKRILIDGEIPVGMNLDFDHFIENISIKIWEKVARINWLPFEEARSFVRQLNLKGSKTWYSYCKSGNKPVDIPVTPFKTYLNKGWKGWGDWVGTYYINNRDRVFLTFKEARNFVRKLKLQGKNEWMKYLLSEGNPDNIPTHPERAYRNKGWSGLGDWLGTGNLKSNDIIYPTFGEARAFMHKLKLNNTHEWKKYCRSGKKPINIPSAPEKVYKGKGWKGIGDWLGTGAVAMSIKGNRKYISYEKAIEVVRKMNLQNVKEWIKYCDSGNKPDNIPPKPQFYYRNRGWNGWDDWLGKS